MNEALVLGVMAFLVFMLGDYLNYRDRNRRR